MKNLVMIAIVALLAVPALADPLWYAIDPDGSPEICVIPVKLVVPAYIECLNCAEAQINLEQMSVNEPGSGPIPDYQGSTELEFTNNCDVDVSAVLAMDGPDLISFSKTWTQVTGVTALTTSGWIESPTPSNATFPALADILQSQFATIGATVWDVVAFGGFGTELYVGNVTVTISVL